MHVVSLLLTSVPRCPTWLLVKWDYWPFACSVKGSLVGRSIKGNKLSIPLPCYFVCTNAICSWSIYTSIVFEQCNTHVGCMPRIHPSLCAWEVVIAWSHQGSSVQVHQCFCVSSAFTWLCVWNVCVPVSTRSVLGYLVYWLHQGLCAGGVLMFHQVLFVGRCTDFTSIDDLYGAVVYWFHQGLCMGSCTGLTRVCHLGSVCEKCSSSLVSAGSVCRRCTGFSRVCV